MLINSIRDMITSFNEYHTSWAIYLGFFIISLSLLMIAYLHVVRGKLINKVFQIHGFEYNDKDTNGNDVHFHNNDLLNGNFKMDKTIFRDGFEWMNRKYLFIPKGKIVTIKKKFNKVTIWYNGYKHKSYTYKTKSFNKDWTKRKLDKLQLLNYNGTFIIGNLFVKTANLSSIKIDSRNKNRDFVLTYIFDNGSERIVKVSAAEFFESTIDTIIPYNAAFLDQCDVIELR